MVQAIQAHLVKLSDLKNKFGLTLVRDPSFFSEWLNVSLEISEIERFWLDRVQRNFSSLLEDPPILENSVKMLVLSPLLDLAGFYQPPYRLETEASMEIEAEDEGEIIRGRIDALILRERFWLVVIESKQSDFTVTKAVPQTLTYMFGNPNPERTTFGMITNGNDFLFLKLVRQPTPQYGNSRLFSLINPGNELYEVLGILKKIGTATLK
ncbi:MAG: restriction endonuclease subunit R [Cyanobacteria bacterium CRU_2_1]|nr:restriction endonuclease subunit R [Cyanobacteria bacterium RU_5_0]NJR59850.1 restriction endonuclease subunit R [Cyanobacteria bacterium CRU_2_1]